ncbi:MAG TPA: hypothetical protein VF647_23580 [Longimicrobium sp.]
MSESGTGPLWSARLLWGAYGLLAGFATGILASLALLTVVGPLAAQFVFRLCAYGFILAGLDYGGERARWRQALLRGFGLGAAIAVLRVVFAIL